MKCDLCKKNDAVDQLEVRTASKGEIFFADVCQECLDERIKSLK